MRAFAIFLFLCLSLTGMAQVHPIYEFSDFTSYPLNVSRVTLTPLSEDAYRGTTNFSPRPLIYTKAAYPTLTNGTITISNLVNGFAYRVEISDSYNVTTFTNYFTTNQVGLVDAATNRINLYGLDNGVIVRVWYEYQTLVDDDSSGVTNNQVLPGQPNLPGFSGIAETSGASVGVDSSGNLVTSALFGWAGSTGEKFTGATFVGTNFTGNGVGLSNITATYLPSGLPIGHALTNQHSVAVTLRNTVTVSNVDGLITLQNSNTVVRLYNINTNLLIDQPVKVLGNVNTIIPSSTYSNASTFLGYGGIQLPSTWYGQEGSGDENTNSLASMIAWWQTGWDGIPDTPDDVPVVPQAFIQVRRNWGGGAVNPDNDRPTFHFATKGDIRIEPSYSHNSDPDGQTYFGYAYMSLGNEDAGNHIYVNYMRGSVLTFPGSGTPEERAAASTLTPYAKGYGLPLQFPASYSKNSVEGTSVPSIWAHSGDTNAADMRLGELWFNSWRGTLDIWQPTVDVYQNPEDKAVTVFKMKTNHVEFGLEGIKTDTIRANTNSQVTVGSKLVVTNQIVHQFSTSTGGEMIVGAPAYGIAADGDNNIWGLYGKQQGTTFDDVFCILNVQDVDATASIINIGGDTGTGRNGATAIRFHTAAAYDGVPVQRWEIDTTGALFNSTATAYDIGKNGDPVGTVYATTLSGAGGGITLNAAGFNGNLATTDNTLQEVAQKLDDLTAGVGDVTQAGQNNFSGSNYFGGSTTFAGTVAITTLNAATLNATAFNLPNAAGSASLSTAGAISLNTTDKQIGIYNGTREVAIPLVHHIVKSFDPDAVCDGAVDRLFIMTVGPDAPKGITITRWNVSFEADPTTEVDLDLKRADAFIGVANSAVMDVLDTTAGASSETTAANINGGAVVANGKVIYLEFGTAYTETTHQIIFEMWYEIEED